MTVKELRKLLKNYDADTLVLMDASMRGFNEAKGTTAFSVVINKRANDNGEGEYVSADEGKRKHRHYVGLILHTGVE